MRGDPVAWLRLVKFSTYKAGILKACRNAIGNALADIRWCRGKLEWIFGTGAMIRRLDEAASALDHISGALEQGIGQAIDELDKALQKLLSEIHPSPSHPAHVGVPAPRPKVVKAEPARVTSGIRAEPTVMASVSHDAGDASHLALGASHGGGASADAGAGTIKAADDGSQAGSAAAKEGDAAGTGAGKDLPEPPSADKGTNVHSDEPFIKLKSGAWKQAPNPEKWIRRGGAVETTPEGGAIYTDANGNTVAYNRDGYPDFTPYAVDETRIPDGFQNYPSDFQQANQLTGRSEFGNESPPGYTWHHVEDGETMQLVPSDIHKNFSHSGGMSIVNSD